MQSLVYLWAERRLEKQSKLLTGSLGTALNAGTEERPSGGHQRIEWNSNLRSDRVGLWRVWEAIVGSLFCAQWVAAEGLQLETGKT